MAACEVLWALASSVCDQVSSYEEGDLAINRLGIEARSANWSKLVGV